LDALATELKDPNYRIFVGDDRLHLVSAGLHLTDADPFVLFESLLASGPSNVDASHAFYLGYELAKATTALTLGKQYEQDRALKWGYLTVEEPVRRAGRPRTERRTDGETGRRRDGGTGRRGDAE
jgi:hypothetical protein